MAFPVNYLVDGVTNGYLTSDESERAKEIAAFLDQRDLVATRKHDPFPGQIARVRIDAYGESASEVEATLLEYASRCDAAMQASECAYGECVIERNLEEQWGETYSWRGRLILHPTIGSIPSSERAANAVSAD